MDHLLAVNAKKCHDDGFYVAGYTASSVPELLYLILIDVDVMKEHTKHRTFKDESNMLNSSTCESPSKPCAEM